MSSDVSPISPTPTTVDELAPLVSFALKTLAKDADYRKAFINSQMLQQALTVPARRYVAPNRVAFLERSAELAVRGYGVAAELVGEGTSGQDEVTKIEAEYLGLIDDLAGLPEPRPTLNFDLSNMGLLTDASLAERTLRRIAKAAMPHGISVILSMEGAELVDPILRIFYSVHSDFPALGLTVQAFRPRTLNDLERLLAVGARLRLVKGVYDEPADTILPRGAELNQRYIDLAKRIAAEGHPLQLATHDETLILSLLDESLPSNVEFEFLHGVRPELATWLRNRGVPIRIYSAYGHNFWLHFLHRLAEHPDNIATALADWVKPSRLEKSVYL